MHLVVLALSLAPSVLSAQQLSLRSCLEQGLKNNYGLQIVKGNERIAGANATKANAGYLPNVSASAGYSGSLDERTTKARGTGEKTVSHGVLDQSMTAGVFAEWTVFDGYKIQTNYKRLQELKRQSEVETRVALEDYVADVTAEYYNYVRQRIRLHNLNYAVSLSRERLRIERARRLLGSNSRLDSQQAQVDFNADSAQCLKQKEVVATSAIRLNELMANRDVDRRWTVSDTTISLLSGFSRDDLWASTIRTNSSLLKADISKALAQNDLRAVRSRDYPYVRLNAGYGYTYNHYNTGTTSDRHVLGADFGVTVGMKLFDGNRRRERLVASITADNAELARQELELSLRAQLADLWQAYQNNLSLLSLERQNLVTARDNHLIACERFLLGNLSGYEMREAQKSLLDAEERILEAEYNTKLCEISLLQISGGIMNYLSEQEY